MMILPRILFFVCLLFVAGRIGGWANSAMPNYGGTAGAEPSGLKDIRIPHENLSIDLRELAAKTTTEERLIAVEAVYEIENTGASKNLDLVFVFGSDYKDFRVWLDDREAETKSVNPGSQQPRAWELPKKTPGLKGGNLDYIIKGEPAQRLFSIVMPKGRSRLRASYRAKPSGYHSSPLRYWQFAYILAPAREWGGFGTLDVTVTAPEEWTIAAAPEIPRADKTIFRRQFDGLPADALTLTAQAPRPKEYGLVILALFALFLLALVGIPLLMIVFVVLCGYRYRFGWILGIVFSALWAISIFYSGIYFAAGDSLAIHPSQYSSSGYEEVLWVLIVFVIAIAAFPVGIALWLLTAFITRKFRLPK